MSYSDNLKHRHTVRTIRIFIAALICVCSGCRALTYDDQSPNLNGQPPVQNPLIVPMMDRWLVMDQVSDEIDNYFKIYREERIRVLDGIMSEGWIETNPRIGGTLLEPWKSDSTPGFERIHATLQTVRRFAKVRVIPMGNSYQIDLRVFKELEDLPQPVGSVIYSQLQVTNSLDLETGDFLAERSDKNWIPMGRDFSLEQKILRNIQQRLNGIVEVDVR
jgi:hypothetical protein